MCYVVPGYLVSFGFDLMPTKNEDKIEFKLVFQRSKVRTFLTNYSVHCFSITAVTLPALLGYRIFRLSACRMALSFW